MGKRRNYIQAKNLRKDAQDKIKDYDAVLGRVRKDYEKLRPKGIRCKAFGEEAVIEVSKQCWNHVFNHPIKRQSRLEKLERALCFDMAIKLLLKTTTYQEVSREKDRGGNEHLYFGIIGYVRGNRIKVVIRKQEKRTNPKYVLFSFFQLSSAPTPKKQEGE